MLFLRVFVFAVILAVCYCLPQNAFQPAMQIQFGPNNPAIVGQNSEILATAESAGVLGRVVANRLRNRPRGTVQGWNQGTFGQTYQYPVSGMRGGGWRNRG